MSSQVVCASKESTVNIVGGEVQTRNDLVETFGNWRKVDLTPLDRELYIPVLAWECIGE